MNNSNTINNSSVVAASHQSSTAAHAAMSVSEQQLRIHQELTAVAYAHAPAFVDAVQSVATAETATNKCRKTSASLQQQLSSFKMAAQKLQENGAAWRAQRQLSASSSASLSKISELLDAPQTIENCIRGGLFHEALVAMQHVRGLCAADQEKRRRRMLVVSQQQQQQQQQNENVSNNIKNKQENLERSTSSESSSFFSLDEYAANSGAATPAILLQVAQQVDATVERLLTTFILSQLSGPLVPSNALKIVIFLQSLAKQQLQDFENNNNNNHDEENEELWGNYQENNFHSNQQQQEQDQQNSGLSILATDPTALPELFLNLRSEFISNEMKEALSLVASMMTLMMMQQQGQQQQNYSLSSNSSSSSSSSFSCLQKMLAVYKVHVSESVATYKTCFVDANSNNTPQISNINAEVVSDKLRDLLSRWSTMHTTKLISLFTLHVSHLTSGADIAMLLEPVAQCGAALSKAGLDVTVILESILVKRAEELFLSSMDQASQSFVIALGAHRWRAVVEVSSASSSSSPTSENTKNGEAGSQEKNNHNNNNSGGGADQTEANNEKKNDSNSADDDNAFVPPPMSLLRFPPLAHAMNSFLTGCNDVRKCALRAIRPTCMHAVLRLIQTIATQLSNVRGSLLLEGLELESLRVMVKAFSQDFVKHVQQCTLKVFGKFDEDLEWKKNISNNIEMLQNTTN